MDLRIFLNVNFRLFFWSLFTSLRILEVFIQNSRQPFSMRVTLCEETKKQRMQKKENIKDSHLL